MRAAGRHPERFAHRHTWWTVITGSGTFSPDPDALNAQYYFGRRCGQWLGGAHPHQHQHGTCPPVQDQLVLTFGNSSFADAGDDPTTCANSPWCN